MNPRQISIVTWIAVGLVAGLANRDVRKSFVGVFQAFTSRDAIVMATTSFAWNCGIVWLLGRARLWDRSLWFDTLSFAIIGTVTLVFRMTDDRRLSWRFFVSVALLNLGASVLLETFVYTYTFGLAVELFLIPWLLMLGLLAGFTQSSDEYHQVFRIVSTLISATGLVMVVRSVAGAIVDPNLLTTATARWLFLPFALTAGYVPYLAALRIWMTYQLACIRCTHGVTRSWLLNAYLLARLVFRFGLNLSRVEDFGRAHGVELRRAASRRTMDAVFAR